MNYNFLKENSQFMKLLEEISKSELYSKITPELGYQHKISHIQKVMLFSQIIGQEENFNEQQINNLLVAAAFHDSGRTKDRDNGEHGNISAEIIRKYFEDKPNYKKIYKVKNDNISVIQVVIAYHVIDDKIHGQVDKDKLLKLCLQYDVNKNENFNAIEKIAAVLKDADALDRYRFSSKNNSRNSLIPELLRTKAAKSSRLNTFARQINQSYAGCILNENYPNEQIIDEDNAKTLQYLRYLYKTSHNGERKIEKEVPISDVKFLFRHSIKEIKERNFEATQEL